MLLDKKRVSAVMKVKAVILKYMHFVFSCIFAPSPKYTYLNFTSNLTRMCLILQEKFRMVEQATENLNALKYNVASAP